MKNKEQYVLAHEFIGSQVEVIYSPDASLTGMRGIIVDETLNTFRVKVSINRHDEMRIVPKKGNTFKIIMHGNNNDNNKENNNNNNNDKGVTVIVNGSKLVHRAHDRLKMLLS
jgi:RNase P/RNase MRP subunit p29